MVNHALYFKGYVDLSLVLLIESLISTLELVYNVECILVHYVKNLFSQGTNVL